MTRYSGYDLDKIKQALGQEKWEAVLSPFQHVRMATATQIQEATGLSRRMVGRTLKALTAVEDVVQDPVRADTDPPDGEAFPTPRARYILTEAGEKVAHRAQHTRPATVYQLGQVGAALLRERGLVKDLRACEEYRLPAIAHSLCILDVILVGLAHGPSGRRAEKELINGAGGKLRADVALPPGAGENAAGWRMLAVEQAASEHNADRVERQVERWRAFFAAAPGAEAVSPTILLLFNLKLAQLPATLAEWRNALAVVTARRGDLPFDLRPQLLADFLEAPEWNAADWARLPDLRPEAKPIPPVEPWRDPLDNLAASASLDELFDWALSIYTPSHSQKDTRARYSVPVASLRALRAWLEASERAETQKALRIALAKLGVQQSPWVAVNILNKIIWDILLRQFGVDRWHLGGKNDLQIAATGPEASDSHGVHYGDYHVRVKLSSELLEELRAAGTVLQHHGENTLPAALEWSLGAIYTYAYELGLRDQPWLAAGAARPKKIQKGK